MKLKYISLILFSSLMFGCSSSSKVQEQAESNAVKDYEQLAAKEELKLQKYIAEVADKALEIQRVRAQIESSLTTPQLDADDVRETLWQNSYIPEGMEREKSIKWEGPAEPLLKSLADMVDYNIDFTGNRNPVEATIVINPNKMNIKRLIDEIYRQANNKGYIEKIEIMEDIKYILVYYKEF